MKLGQRLASATLLLALACGATSRNGRDEGGGGPEPSGGAGSGEGGATSEAASCVLAEPRFIRLTLPQLVSGVRDALGDELADGASEDLAIDGPRAAFLAHDDPSEGYLIAGAVFQKTDELAQRAGRYVAEHFALTGCANDDFGCVSDYVASLAEKAFRRPVADEELEPLLLTVERAQAIGVSAIVAAEYGVYAVFSSPRALYRTELGDGSNGGEVRLDPYELASQLSYLLTDRAPDAALLEAAESGSLETDEAIREQVARLLELGPVRAQLQQSLARQLGIGGLPELVVDPQLYPEYTAELASAMGREVDELFAATLWSAPLGALLTTRTATLNQDLALLYGVPFPPAGVNVDASGFASLELPETRAGLLTRAGMWLGAIGPDEPQLLRRGRIVATGLLCEPPPTTHSDSAPPAQPSSGTARERAEYRLTDAACRDCHAQVDPLGLALEGVDALGRLRDADARAALPDFAGGAEVDGAVELSYALPVERVASCLGQRYLQRALASSNLPEAACERESLARRLATGEELTFSRVLEEVALSRALRLRRR